MLILGDMKKFFVVLFVSLWAVISAFAVSDAVIKPLDSSLYEDMDDLYALNGLARPSTNRPWSNAEARLILSKVDASNLDDVSKGLYSRILSVLEQDTTWNFGDFGLTVGMDFSFESYMHTNTEAFTTETDWERGFDDRKSLMKLYFEFTSNDNFYTTSDIHYKYRRADMLDEYTKYEKGTADGRLSNDGYVASYKLEGFKNLYYVAKSYHFSQGITSNVFTDTRHFSFIWPRRAVFSFGGTTWNFSINRDILSLGNARFGNMLVDDHTFSDYAKLSFFGRNFKYDLVFMFMNSIVESGETTPNEEARIYMIHTLQFRIADMVSLTVSENVMYKYKTLDFSYMNPAFIYHNLNNRSMFNAMAYADLNVALPYGLETYGQFALDQARAPHEDDSQSGAYGLVAGLGYTDSLLGGVVKAYCEYAKTSPLLYRRDGVDFVRMTIYPSVDAATGRVDFFDYIGFPYGGDCRLVEIGASFDSLEGWDVGVFGRFAEKGEMSIFHSHNRNGNNADKANLKGDTPYGDVSKRFAVIGLKANADLGAFFTLPMVSFEAELDWVGRCSHDNASGSLSNKESDLQFSIGMTVGL